MAALTAALAWGLMATVPVGTQGTTTPASSTIAPATPATVVEHLDRLLASKDYLGLTQAIVEPPDAAALRTNLDWLRDRMRDGSTSLVAILYARMLWEITAGRPEADVAGLRDMAVLAMLYAYGAITVDGQRCGDATAPAHRRQQILALPGLLQHYRAMPTERQDAAVEGALMTDRVTAAAREREGDVAFVCTAGLEETSYNLKNGTAREVPAKPGQIGRQVLLSGDGRYRPSERPEAEWRPAMARERATLPALFRQLQGTPTNR